MWKREHNVCQLGLVIALPPVHILWFYVCGCVNTMLASLVWHYHLCVPRMHIWIHCAWIHCAWIHCAWIHCAWIHCAWIHCVWIHCAWIQCVWIHHCVPRVMSVCVRVCVNSFLCSTRRSVRPRMHLWIHVKMRSARLQRNVSNVYGCRGMCQTFTVAEECVKRLRLQRNVSNVYGCEECVKRLRLQRNVSNVYSCRGMNNTYMNSWVHEL